MYESYKKTNKALFFSQKLKNFELKKYPLLNPYLRRKVMVKGTIGAVLMLHRVTNYGKSRLVPNEDLRSHLLFFKRPLINTERQVSHFYPLMKSMMLSQEKPGLISHLLHLL